jgi:hypothetical protein
MSYGAPRCFCWDGAFWEAVLCRKRCWRCHERDEVRHGFDPKNKNKIPLAWAGNLISFVVGWLLLRLKTSASQKPFVK